MTPVMSTTTQGAPGRVALIRARLHEHNHGETGHLGSDQAGAIDQIDIVGELGQAEYAAIVRAANELIEAGSQQALVTMDSGGGGLAGQDDAVRALIMLRESMPGGHWTFVRRFCASAAYALGAAAGPGRFVAGHGSQVGNIGIVLETRDTSRLFREELLTTVEYEVGTQALKPHGFPGQKTSSGMTEAFKAQGASHQQIFMAIAATARGVTSSQMLEMAGGGQMFSPAQAKASGLIDLITTEGELRILLQGDQRMNVPFFGNAAQAAPPDPSETPSQKEIARAVAIVHRLSPQVQPPPLPAPIVAPPQAAGNADGIDRLARLMEGMAQQAATATAQLTARMEQQGTELREAIKAVAVHATGVIQDGETKKLETWKAQIMGSAALDATAKLANWGQVQAAHVAGLNPQVLVDSIAGLPAPSMGKLEEALEVTVPGLQGRAAQIVDITPYGPQAAQGGSDYRAEAIELELRIQAARTAARSEAAGMAVIEADFNQQIRDAN